MTVAEDYKIILSSVLILFAGCHVDEYYKKLYPEYFHRTASIINHIKRKE